MILSSLEHSKRVEALHPLLERLFDYVKSRDWTLADTGRIELDGDRLFINCVETDLLPADRQMLEIHREYMDVHIPLDETETIGWKSAETLRQEATPYDRESECALYTDRPDTYVEVKPGQFLIVWPEDAHAPVIGQRKLRKLIAKVKL